MPARCRSTRWPPACAMRSIPPRLRSSRRAAAASRSPRSRRSVAGSSRWRSRTSTWLSTRRACRVARRLSRPGPRAAIAPATRPRRFRTRARISSPARSAMGRCAARRSSAPRARLRRTRPHRGGKMHAARSLRRPLPSGGGSPGDDRPPAHHPASFVRGLLQPHPLRRAGSLGGACTFQDPCGRENHCGGGTCRAGSSALVGEACTAGGCERDAICLGGKCVRQRAEGLCTQDVECLGGCRMRDGGRALRTPVPGAIRGADQHRPRRACKLPHPTPLPRGEGLVPPTGARR